MSKADEGANQLKEVVDSLIVIPNDRLLGLAGKNMGILDAFKPADDVLRQAVQGISDLITTSGLINVDFADVKAIMSERGMAMMGIGMAEGERGAAEAAQKAISSPLLEDIDISGAKGVLVNISGSANMTMEEFDEASRIIHEKVHEDANIIIGLVMNEDLGDRIRSRPSQRVSAPPSKRESQAEELKPGAAFSPGQVDRDLPTFIRERQKDFSRSPRSTGDDEQEYDIPTFLRKRVD